MMTSLFVSSIKAGAGWDDANASGFAAQRKEGFTTALARCRVQPMGASPFAQAPAGPVLRFP
jgi:hypothetical protein